MDEESEICHGLHGLRHEQREAQHGGGGGEDDGAIPHPNLPLHSYTNSRDHRYTGAATTIHWLSFGFQRPHRSPFKLN